jgi:hypothetical protein
MGCCTTKLELPIEKYTEIQSKLLISVGGVEKAEEEMNQAMFAVLELVANRDKYSKTDRKVIDGLHESLKKRYYKVRHWKNRKRNLTWPRTR